MDFYDKLVISITFIIVTFVAIFNTFCFAAEGTLINPVILKGYDYGDSGFYERSNYDTTYWPVSPGHTYNFLNSSSGRTILFLSEKPSIGVTFDSYQLVQGNSTFTFTVPEDGYVFISNSHSNTVTDVGKLYDLTDSFKEVALLLSRSVGVSNLWEIFENSVAYIGVVVLVSFGFYLIFHNIKEVSKGKEKMN